MPKIHSIERWTLGDLFVWLVANEIEWPTFDPHHTDPTIRVCSMFCTGTGTRYQAEGRTDLSALRNCIEEASKHTEPDA